MEAMNRIEPELVGIDRELAGIARARPCLRRPIAIDWRCSSIGADWLSRFWQIETVGVITQWIELMSDGEVTE